MNADLAPDGRHAAVTIHEGMRSDVWLADAERGALSRLTFEGHNIEPVFTPDGRQVTYAAGGRGPLNLFSVPADGSGAPMRLLASPLEPVPQLLVGGRPRARVHGAAPGNGRRPVGLHARRGAAPAAPADEVRRGPRDALARRTLARLREQRGEALGGLRPAVAGAQPALAGLHRRRVRAPVVTRRPHDLLRLGGRHAARGGRRGRAASSRPRGPA